MPSMRDIKRRRDSIASIQKITKAMKLVSTVKLQKTRGRAESLRPYFQSVYDTVTTILARTGPIRHPYLTAGAGSAKAVLVITSDRGLAGGYHANVARMVMETGFPQEDVALYVVGQKGRESLERRGYTVVADYSQVVPDPSFEDAEKMAGRLLKDFRTEKVGEIYLAYTAFKNTMVQEPRLVKLLPVERDPIGLGKGSLDGPMNYEPGEEEVLDVMIPRYVTSLLYAALIQSQASEYGARMQAMDAATGNAQEMMEHLALQYNRARQSSITRELTEMIAGAEAIR